MNISETSTLKLHYYSDRIIVSKEPVISFSQPQSKRDVMLQNRSTSYNGFMSPATKRKVRSILTAWVSSVNEARKLSKESGKMYNRRLTFVTVTLSGKQQHTDNEIKRNMLNRFILILQKKYSVKYYFWRAEKQKNGNIHFHLIVDHFIDKKDLQMEWNKIQADNGYLADYHKKTGHNNAPSTDIRAMPEDNSVLEYVLKYVSKNPDDIESAELQIKGRIWGCSDELRKLKPYMSGEEQKVGEALHTAVQSGEASVFDSDHFQVYSLNVQSFLRRKCPFVLKYMSTYYQFLFERLYIPEHQQVATINPEPEPVTKRLADYKQLSLFPDHEQDVLSLRSRTERAQH